MTIQIKLEKVPQRDLELFKNALASFTVTCQMILEISHNHNSAKDLSIATELWYYINKKTVQQHPPEKSKVELALHKAYVLLEALKGFSCEGIDTYDRSRCSRYYMAIDEQLPTSTQLAIQLK